MNHTRPGSVVLVHCAPSIHEHESWLRGDVVSTVARGRAHAVHVIRPTAFRWKDQHWTPYAGTAAEIIARELKTEVMLEWLDTWPRTWNMNKEMSTPCQRGNHPACQRKLCSCTCHADETSEEEPDKEEIHE